MSPSEIVDAIMKAGASIQLVDGRPRVRGPKLGESLMAEIKSQRDAVMEEWTRRGSELKDRYACVPAEEPLHPDWDLPAESDWAEVRGFVERQTFGRCGLVVKNETMRAWVYRRELEYHASGIKNPQEQCVRACLDVLCWQTGRAPKEAVQLIKDFKDVAESARTMKSNFPQA